MRISTYPVMTSDGEAVLVSFSGEDLDARNEILISKQQAKDLAKQLMATEYQSMLTGIGTESKRVGTWISTSFQS